MKRFIEGVDRSQAMLFPERLDDYVGEDNGELPLGWHDPLEMLDKAD